MNSFEMDIILATRGHYDIEGKDIPLSKQVATIIRYHYSDTLTDDELNSSCYDYCCYMCILAKNMDLKIYQLMDKANSRHGIEMYNYFRDKTYRNYLASVILENLCTFPVKEVEKRLNEKWNGIDEKLMEKMYEL